MEAYWAKKRFISTSEFLADIGSHIKLFFYGIGRSLVLKFLYFSSSYARGHVFKFLLLLKLLDADLVVQLFIQKTVLACSILKLSSLFSIGPPAFVPLITPHFAFQVRSFFFLFQSKWKYEGNK